MHSALVLHILEGVPTDDVLYETKHNTVCCENNKWLYFSKHCTMFGNDMLQINQKQ